MKKIVDEDELVRLLDNFAESEVGRLKVQVKENLVTDGPVRTYHIGRCDIGSPFAKGTPFDVLPDDSCN